MKLFYLCSYSIIINGLFIGLNQTSVSAFTLDLFSDANDEPFPGEFLQQVDVDRNNLSDFDIDTGLAGTDLGERRLEITLASDSRRSGFINVDTFLGEAAVNSAASTTIDLAKFTWGSDSATPQDITNGGVDDSFLIDIVSIDLTGATFTFSFEDSGNDTGNITSQPVNSTGNIYFPYSTLSTNFPDVDQTAIREISLEITNAPPDFDASFDFIRSAVEPVPVPFEFNPSLGLILCSGLFGINKLKKRLNASKA